MIFPLPNALGSELVMRLAVKQPPTISREELLSAALIGLQSAAHNVESRIRAIERILRPPRKPVTHALELTSLLPKRKHKRGA